MKQELIIIDGGCDSNGDEGSEVKRGASNKGKCPCYVGLSTMMSV